VSSCLFAIQGCSGWEEGEVTGKVTFNGSPFDKAGGQVVFVAADGSQVKASIDSDGSYRAEGVKTGPNRVAVFYPNPDLPSGRHFPKKGKGEPAPPAYLTPVKYAAVDTSGLSIDVEKATVFNVDMKGPKSP